MPGCGAAAGFSRPVPPGLALLLDHARRAGVDQAKLRGELGLDPVDGLDRFEHPAAAQPHWDEAAAVVGWCASNTPRLRALAIQSRWLHEAGAATALEIAYLIAGATEAIRQLGDRGQPFDVVAANLAFRVPVSTELLGQVAKLRALRLLWAKVAAAYLPDGAPLPAVPVVAYSSERSRARRFDLHTNLLRGTLEAVAAAIGGADSLCLTPFDPHPDYQDDDAQLLARHQHAMLREEGLFGHVADPAGGSHAVEWLTDDLARRAWEVVREIERRGGLTAAMCDGSMNSLVLDDTSERLVELRTRARTHVGISRYVDPELEGKRRLIHDRSAAVEAMEARLAHHDDDPVRTKALERLRGAAEGAPAELVPAAARAAEAGATAFEISEAVHSLGSDHEDAAPDAPRETPEEPAPFLVDVTSFEDLRATVEEDGLPPAALVVSVADGRTARRRSSFAQDLLRAGGFRVTAAERAPDELESLLRDARPDVLVLCPEGDLAPDLCAASPGQPVVVGACPPSDAAGAEVDVLLFDGADVLLRLDYIAKLVELARLGDDPGEDLEQPLREALEVMRDHMSRGEAAR